MRSPRVAFDALNHRVAAWGERSVRNAVILVTAMLGTLAGVCWLMAWVLTRSDGHGVRAIEMPTAAVFAITFTPCAVYVFYPVAKTLAVELTRSWKAHR